MEPVRPDPCLDRVHLHAAFGLIQQHQRQPDAELRRESGQLHHQRHGDFWRQRPLRRRAQRLRQRRDDELQRRLLDLGHLRNQLHSGPCIDRLHLLAAFGFVQQHQLQPDAKLRRESDHLHDQRHGDLQQQRLVRGDAQRLRQRGNHEFQRRILDLGPAGNELHSDPRFDRDAFTPPSASFSNISSNQTQNFTATQITYTISGTVTYNGSGLSGVTLSGCGSGATTNSSGAYSISVSSGTSCTLTPTLGGYTFSPASAAFTNITSNQTQNFTATGAHPPSAAR